MNYELFLKNLGTKSKENPALYLGQFSPKPSPNKITRWKRKVGWIGLNYQIVPSNDLGPKRHFNKICEKLSDPKEYMISNSNATFSENEGKLCNVSSLLLQLFWLNILLSQSWWSFNGGCWCPALLGQMRTLNWHVQCLGTPEHSMHWPKFSKFISWILYFYERLNFWLYRWRLIGLNYLMITILLQTDKV